MLLKCKCILEIFKFKNLVRVNICKFLLLYILINIMLVIRSFNFITYERKGGLNEKFILSFIVLFLRLFVVKEFI